MRRILIFGNSGSGKSTLAARLAAESGLAHLDLDSLAWLPTQPPERMPMAESVSLINAFTENNPSWVVEGCYTDLLQVLADKASEILFLNLPIELCVQNAKNRPWEAHKYESREAQDANLEMLLDWIAQYDTRGDVFSLAAHTKFYEDFSGIKNRILCNEHSFI
ncbi:MAG: AAA family ATPase [Pseudohongiellaceae bacterium]